MKKLHKKDAVAEERQVTAVLSDNEPQAEENKMETALPEMGAVEEEKEFDSFFAEVMKNLPKMASAAVVNAYDKSKVQAERILGRSKTRFEGVFDEFLEGVDEETHKKSHSIVHAASLTAAITMITTGLVTILPIAIINKLFHEERRLHLN